MVADQQIVHLSCVDIDFDNVSMRTLQKVFAFFFEGRRGKRKRKEENHMALSEIWMFIQIEQKFFYG